MKLNSRLYHFSSPWTPPLNASSAFRFCTTAYIHSYKSSRSPLIFSLSSPVPHKPSTRHFSQCHLSNMSFSNTDTGDKTADPYKAKNLDEPPLKEKIDGLVNFVTAHKFVMLTTKHEHSELLVSRCMAVAATVSLIAPSQSTSTTVSPFSLTVNCAYSRLIGKRRYRLYIPYQHRVWKNRRSPCRLGSEYFLPQLHRRMGFYCRESDRDHGPSRCS